MQSLALRAVSPSPDGTPYEQLPKDEHRCRAGGIPFAIASLHHAHLFPRPLSFSQAHDMSAPLGASVVCMGVFRPHGYRRAWPEIGRPSTSCRVRRPSPCPWVLRSGDNPARGGIREVPVRQAKKRRIMIALPVGSRSWTHRRRSKADTDLGRAEALHKPEAVSVRSTPCAPVP
jgi:hypothetical protein